MTEQLSLFAPDTVRPYTPHPEVGVSADEQQAIHKAGIAACSGQAFNTDPGAYEEYLTEVARKTAAAAAIAACRKTLWENHLRREGWEEPNWEQIAADAQAQHLRDNAA
jgi:hypothetical protein